MTRPVIIIGAARSGTKILRDVLAEATGTACVPYDIGFVWRYGNEHRTDDVLEDSTVTPRIMRFIRGYVDGYAPHRNAAVLEKTVGNTLRVPFVHAVMPDATFVHLIRNGVDVTESARRQWKIQPPRDYLMKKVRHFPLRLAPTYGRKYLASQLANRPRGTGRATWGPRYPLMDSDLARDGLLPVCARQWRYSVELASADLSGVSAPTVEIRYEDLVSEPAGVLETIAATAGLTLRPAALREVIPRVRGDRTGTGLATLSRPERLTVAAEIDPTLMRLGYPSALPTPPPDPMVPWTGRPR